MRGVVTGITTVARASRRCAASATPCAWFPALAQITPRARRSGERCAILLYAPRSLNENTGCLSSRLSSTWLPVRREIDGAGSSGVSTATSYTLAVRILSRYLSLAIARFRTREHNKNRAPSFGYASRHGCECAEEGGRGGGAEACRGRHDGGCGHRVHRQFLHRRAGCHARAHQGRGGELGGEREAPS